MGVLALSVVLGGIWAAGILQACGELVPPLDDTYIYLQYARQAAHGEPLAYQPGAEPTRGATSLLYPLLLAPAARVLPPEQLVWAALALGVLGLAATALAVGRLLARTVGQGASWLGAALTLACGHFVWGALSGMEIGLFAALLTGSLALVGWYAHGAPETAGRRLGILAGVLFLTGLARPEALPPVGLLTAGVVLLRHAPHTRSRRAWLLAVAPLAALVTVAVNLAARGVPGTNALAAKAIWSEPRPDVLAGMLERLPRSFVTISRAIVTDGFNPSWGGLSGPVLETLLWIGVAAAVLVVWRVGPDRGTVRLAVGVLLLAALSGLVPVVFATHYYRYQMPYMPLALAVAVWGWYRVFPRGSRLPLVVGVVLLALLAPGLPRFVKLAARNAANMAEQQVAGGRWIDEHLPADAVVGINDAGALAYFGRRRVVDLVGLVTNGSALPNRAGQGSLYEWLERLHDPDRPTHFVLFPDWYPYLTRTSLVGDVVHRIRLLDNTISGGDLKSFHRADWSRVDRENALVTRANLLDLWGFDVVDEVDVGSLASQTAHDYRALPTWRDLLREYPVAKGSPVVRIDGGRQVREEERFTLRCRPGVPGALVLRTEAYREFTLVVSIDGREAGRLEAPRRSLVWSELLLDLPGELFTAETAEFRLRYEGTDPEGYPAFHYWLLQ